MEEVFRNFLDEQEESKTDLYIVERILSKKLVKKQPYYLVKWKDYSHKFNTWEPLENLENVRDLIKAFEKRFLNEKDHLHNYNNNHTKNNHTTKPGKNKKKKTRKKSVDPDVYDITNQEYNNFIKKSILL